MIPEESVRREDLAGRNSICGAMPNFLPLQDGYAPRGGYRRYSADCVK